MGANCGYRPILLCAFDIDNVSSTGKHVLITAPSIWSYFTHDAMPTIDAVQRFGAPLSLVSLLAYCHEQIEESYCIGSDSITYNFGLIRSSSPTNYTCTTQNTPDRPVHTSCSQTLQKNLINKYYYSSSSAYSSSVFCTYYEETSVMDRRLTFRRDKKKRMKNVTFSSSSDNNKVP